MNIRSCYHDAMDYVDALSTQFNCYFAEGTQYLAQEDATLLVTAMISLIHAVAKREISFDVARQMTKIFNRVSVRPIEGADVEYNGNLLFQTADLSERQSGNDLDRQMAELGEWVRQLDGACYELSVKPETCQTACNLTTAFLRRVSFHNVMSMESEQLDVKELNR